MAKKVVLSGYYGFNNFGDEAILSVLIDHLRQIGADVTVLSASPFSTSRMHGVNAVKNFNILALMLAIKNSDVLISGGGSLLQDVTSLKSLLYYAFVIWFAQLCGKPVLVFAQGIGPLTKDISRNIVLNLLSKCDVVTVRDIKSQEFLQEAGIDASLVSDPVFSVDLPRGETEEIIGVQLRDFKTLNDEFLFNLAKEIITNFSEKKIELYVFQEALDMAVSKKFEKILKTIYPKVKVSIVHSLSQMDMMVKISKLEYLIAMRFHAVLVAIKTGVRTLAINYDAKVAKLAFEAYLPLLTLSGDNDFATEFEKMKLLNSGDLLKFANSKTFEWEYFDEYLR